MLKTLSKDVLYQVSSNLGEVKSFYRSIFDASQKAPCLSKVWKSLPGKGLWKFVIKPASIERCSWIASEVSFELKKKLINDGTKVFIYSELKILFALS